MTRPVLAVLGYGRAGKDTTAHWLAQWAGYRYAGSTSEFLCPYVAERLGISEAQAFAERHQNRQFWYDLGNELRRGDPLFLVRQVLAQGDLIVGLRDYEEVVRLPEAGVALRLWIDRKVPPDPTCTFTAADCDRVIPNHERTPMALYDRLARLMAELRVPCDWPSPRTRHRDLLWALRDEPALSPTAAAIDRGRVRDGLHRRWLGLAACPDAGAHLHPAARPEWCFDESPETLAALETDLWISVRGGRIDQVGPVA